jgi:hypothetical protein
MDEHCRDPVEEVRVVDTEHEIAVAAPGEAVHRSSECGLAPVHRFRSDEMGDRAERDRAGGVRGHGPLGRTSFVLGGLDQLAGQPRLPDTHVTGDDDAATGGDSFAGEGELVRPTHERPTIDGSGPCDGSGPAHTQLLGETLLRYRREK